MKVTYDPKTDPLSVIFKDRTPVVESDEDKVLKIAKAKQAEADADKKRTEAAIILGRAQNEAAERQAGIEKRMTKFSGLQTPGLRG